jgi:Sulfotransferase domain
VRGKIFNIGLNRAGTTSLTAALKILGYRAVHFQHQGVRIFDRVRQNGARGRRLLDGLEQHYDAFSDFAAHGFFETLDRQYPGSRFILTTRELQSWLDSRERKVRKNLADPNYKHAFTEVKREAWSAQRQAYLARLDRYFAARPADFLIMDITAGEGWDNLCRFLGKPVPEQPFPRLNELAGRNSTDDPVDGGA